MTTTNSFRDQVKSHVEAVRAAQAAAPIMELRNEFNSTLAQGKDVSLGEKIAYQQVIETNTANLIGLAQLLASTGKEIPAELLAQIAANTGFNL